MLFPRHDSGMLSISLPYSETDASGNTTNHIFSGQKIERRTTHLIISPAFTSHLPWQQAKDKSLSPD
jgi:hypothetical protein